MWSPTGKDIFYAGTGAQQRLMVVPYSTVGGNTFKPEKPRPWSEVGFSSSAPITYYGPGFDMHPDGKRFVVAPAASPAGNQPQSQLVFIFNFFDDLRQRAPLRK